MQNFVTLRIGQDHPAAAVRLAMIGDKAGAHAEKVLDFGVTSACCWPQIEVHTVLDRLAFGNGDETAG